MRDHKIREFFRKNLESIPKAPQAEYQDILARSRRERGSSFWLVPTIFAGVIVVILSVVYLEKVEDSTDDSLNDAWLYLEDSREEDIIDDYIYIADSF